MATRTSQIIRVENAAGLSHDVMMHAAETMLVSEQKLDKRNQQKGGNTI